MSEPKHSLINICSCKTPIHTSCLLELNKHKPLNKCTICLTKYKLSVPVYRAIGLKSNIKDPAIFFPYTDFYYEPLLCRSEPIKYNFAFRTGINESDIFGSGQYAMYVLSAYADKRINKSSALQLGTDVFFSNFLKKSRYESQDIAVLIISWLEYFFLSLYSIPLKAKSINFLVLIAL